MPLTGVLAAIVGLILSLFIRPRRTWVRAVRENGSTVVQVAGLDRVAGGDLVGAVDDITTDLRPRSQDQASTEDMEHA